MKRSRWVPREKRGDLGNEDRHVPEELIAKEMESLERFEARIRAGTHGAGKARKSKTYRWDGEQWRDRRGNPHPEPSTMPPGPI